MGPGGGAALSCLLSVPRAIRVLRTERPDGISASTYVIVLGNAAVWAAWATCTGEHAVGMPALINGRPLFSSCGGWRSSVARLETQMRPLHRTLLLARWSAAPHHPLLQIRPR